MSDPALRQDVIAALRDAKGVSVTELADGSIEIAAVNQMIRRYVFRGTVSRNLLWKFVYWYGVPIEAFFKSYRVMPETDAASE